MRVTFLVFISCTVISCRQVVMEKDILRKDGMAIRGRQRDLLPEMLFLNFIAVMCPVNLATRVVPY